jgi:hypothetical protein
LAHQACDDIESASCGGTDNQAHGPRRIGLRRSEARDGRERRSAGGEMQKISAADASLRLDAGLLDDRPPFFDLGLLVVPLLDHLVGAQQE